MTLANESWPEELSIPLLPQEHSAGVGDSQVQHYPNLSSLQEWNEAAVLGAPYGRTYKWEDGLSLPSVPRKLGTT